MSKLTAILEPDANGTVHFPLPPELRHLAVKVTVTVEPAVGAARPQFGCFAGKIKMADDFDEPLADFGEYME